MTGQTFNQVIKKNKIKAIIEKHFSVMAFILSAQQVTPTDGVGVIFELID